MRRFIREINLADLPAEAPDSLALVGLVSLICLYVTVVESIFQCAFGACVSFVPLAKHNNEVE